MKKALLILASLAAGLSALGGLDLSGIISFVPDKWASILAVVPPIAAALVHSIMAVGDILDDGKKNDSFPGSSGLSLILLFVGLSCLLALNSCAPLASIVSGQEIQTEPIETARGKTLQVSSLDLARAEADLDQEKAWGLYDAGEVKDRLESFLSTSEGSK